MANVARVTITLPDDLVRDMDRQHESRSQFITEAVRHELDRRHRLELERSLENPNPESVALAEIGFSEWAQSLPEEDTGALVDLNSGTPVRWVPGEGWIEGE